MTKRYERDLAGERHHSKIDEELRAVIDKFPQWPNDMFHALTIVQEEVGELAKAVLQFHYEPNKGKSETDIRAEAIQSIAMLHRFLNSLDTGRYVRATCNQHEYPM